MIQLDNDDFCPNLQKIDINKVYSSNDHFYTRFYM